MNAPAQLPQPPRESTVEQAYASTIAAFITPTDEMDMAVRVAIAMKRDAAATGAGRAGDSAAAILHEVVRIATGTVYAEIPTSRLIRINSSLSFVIEAARAVERALR